MRFQCRMFLGHPYRAMDNPNMFFAANVNQTNDGF
jgi:hypothetical protein